MKVALRDAGLAESILDTVSLPNICKIIGEMTDRKQKEAAKRFTTAVENQDKILTIINQSKNHEILRFMKLYQKHYIDLVKNLLSHSIVDFHFIERSEPNEDCEGYVALLREIRFIPLELAEKIQKGLDFEHFQSTCDQNPRFRDKLSLRHRDDYCLATGLLNSPFIEHFMQRFTQLYSRIGITDFGQEKVFKLNKIINFSQGDDQ